MDRIAERIRMGQEDAKMLAAIDQASLDALAQAIVRVGAARATA